VDRTQAMVDNLWPGPKQEAHCTDWLALTLPDGSRDLVLCDGGLHPGAYDHDPGPQDVWGYGLTPKQSYLIHHTVAFHYDPGIWGARLTGSTAPHLWSPTISGPRRPRYRPH